jgi:flagellar biosynthesis protein FliR
MPIDISQVELFVLVFIRATSAFAVLPIFSHSAVPATVKAGLAGVLSLLLVPALGTTVLPATGTILDFVQLAMREAICGILLGMAGRMLFYGVEVAGQLIGFQAGFSVVASIDPNTESESTVITQVYNIAAMLVFLAIGGHHMMLRALTDSLHVVPIGKLSVNANFAQWMLAAAAGVLADGVRLAVPVMVTLLLTDVGLGILVRVAPMMNIFVIGFPLKVGLTMLMVSLTLSAVMAMFSNQCYEYVRHVPAFLKLLVAS